MTTDPYRIEGPALISFSGGRSSGYMLHKIVQAHGGTLPSDVLVAFADTGKEMPETLDFVRDCAEHWGVPIRWLEYHPEGVRAVDWHTASRNGEPYTALIRSKRYLPNAVTRFCTIELKIRVMRDLCRSLGWDHWVNIVGLRADEPRRVARAKARNESGKEPFTTYAPMYAAKATKRDVAAYWRESNFDLALPNINGATPMGNCDFCFLKDDAILGGIARDRPDLVGWWLEAEAEATALTGKESGARFRSPERRQLSDIVKMARNQGDLLGSAAHDESIDCACTD